MMLASPWTAVGVCAPDTTFLAIGGLLTIVVITIDRHQAYPMAAATSCRQRQNSLGAGAVAASPCDD